MTPPIILPGQPEIPELTVEQQINLLANQLVRIIQRQQAFEQVIGAAVAQLAVGLGIIEMPEEEAPAEQPEES